MTALARQSRDRPEAQPRQFEHLRERCLGLEAEFKRAGPRVGIVLACIAVHGGWEILEAAQKREHGADNTERK